MLDQLALAIFSFTSVLIWPIALLLLFAVGHSAFLAGDAFVERIQRRGQAAALKTVTTIPAPMANRQGMREWLVQRGADPTASSWLVLDRTEAALAKRVDRSRLWVRIAPALGLMGTLVPLGPALVALANNDLATLSNHLVLAFGTTVLGLLAAGLSWVVMTAQDRWYRLDLAELRHALESAE
ncbi:MotA/TolQ/ExbB proton channel family protein [Hyphomicrobium sp. CS1GBMeth3]|uniref:MotA/TolQ/ExbB proton channel family protein n=1 Tax=Hyphomicrobium sp. CS1GBMeth3 TaxID=1892845 RepID=UPI0009320614|nr:MotA/TolQ/ExbB proton channel family protein [Hyphomicrobium sp. CS1GBMeth3]